jgi:hypothetical protein
MKPVIKLVVALAMFAAINASQSASANALDDCILDITFQCVEADDFWDCYDTGKELCENQNTAIIQGLSKIQLKTLERENRRKATAVLKKHRKTRQ